MVPLLRVQGGTIRVESGKLAQRFFVFTREAGKVTELSYAACLPIISFGLVLLVPGWHRVRKWKWAIVLAGLLVAGAAIVRREIASV